MALIYHNANNLTANSLATEEQSKSNVALNNFNNKNLAIFSSPSSSTNNLMNELCTNETLLFGMCYGMPVCGFCYDFGQLLKPSRKYEIYNLAIIGVILPTMGLFGLMGNSIAAFIYSRKNMQSSLNAYLCTLAFSDITIVFTSFFLFFLESLRKRSAIVSKYYALLAPIMFPLGLTAQSLSVFLTIAGALDCFVLVIASERIRKLCCTVRTSKRVILFIVIFACFFNLPHLFEIIVVNCWSVPYKMPSYDVCPTALRQNETYYKFYYAFLYTIFMAVGPVVLLLILNTIIIFSLRNVELENVSSKTKKINEKQLTVKNNYYDATAKTKIYQIADNNNSENNQNKIFHGKKSLEQVEIKVNSESLPLLNNTCCKKDSKSLTPPSISMASLLPSTQHLSITATAPPSLTLALSNGSLNTTNLLSNANATSRMMCDDKKIYSNNTNNCSTIIGTLVESNQKNVESNEKNESATDIMTLVLVVCLFISCNILPLTVNFIELMFNLVNSYLMDLSNLMVVLNSSCNFIIYYTFSKPFRKTLKMHLNQSSFQT